MQKIKCHQMLSPPMPVTLIGSLVGGRPNFMADARYVTNGAAGLLPGQVALLATDGLWESRNEAGEMYGKKRVRQALARQAAKPAAAIVAGLLEDLRAFLRGVRADDDVTLVVIKASQAA